MSARTEPGCSGSPVLSEVGWVVGIAYELLFEKEKFEEKVFFRFPPQSLSMKSEDQYLNTYMQQYLNPFNVRADLENLKKIAGNLKLCSSTFPAMIV